jgi:PAS domain S-box-containing protein
MKPKMELSSVINPNPVLRVAKDGTVLYSNKACEPLLHEWCMTVGDKLPSDIRVIVQKVISQNSLEKKEIKAGNRVYLISLHHLIEEECVNIYGFDISDQKALEEKLSIKEKQNNVLHLIGKIALEYDSLQTFMDESMKMIANTLELEFCKIMELLPDGRFLLRAGTGWKSEFVGKQVVGGEKESQAGYTLLSRTPVIVEDFEKENRFNKPDILKIHGVGSGVSVVIGSMEKPFGVLVVNSTKKRRFTSDDTYFLNSVAFLIAQVVERKKAEEALRESKAQLTAFLEQVPVGIGLFDNRGCPLVINKNLRHFAGSFLPSGENRIDWRWRSWGSDGRLLDKSEWPGTRALRGENVNPGIDFLYTSDEGKEIWTRVSAVPFRNNIGDIIGLIGVVQEIDSQKRAEESLKKVRNTLEEKVKERTAELEKAYDSLKESERRLAEAQKLAHVGSYDWNIVTNEEYWSDELYHIFGLDPQIELDHNTFLNGVHPEDLEFVIRANNEALNGKPYNIDYRIILPDGEERFIHSQGGVIFDEKNTPIRMRGIVHDITEHKKVEEALAKIEIARKQEVHHRIKNNLQVISSLLDLQAEKFNDKEVVEAFRESQNRVISMALIHEELYRGEGLDKIDFSLYIKELADNLLLTYRLGTNVNLEINIKEKLFFNMDTAVPLGIIVNELVSNSLKHAFSGRDKGEIKIELGREEKEKYKEEGCNNIFTLIVSDNGIGIPDNLNIKDLDSLGLQLVTSLVDQLDGELELKRDNGTQFTIRFAVTEKE